MSTPSSTVGGSLTTGRPGLLPPGRARATPAAAVVIEATSTWYGNGEPPMNTGFVESHWYTTERLARVLGVDPSSLRRWRTARAPAGPAVREDLRSTHHLQRPRCRGVAPQPARRPRCRRMTPTRPGPPPGLSLQGDIEYRPDRPLSYRARVRWTNPVTKARHSKSEAFAGRTQAEAWIEDDAATRPRRRRPRFGDHDLGRVRRLDHDPRDARTGTQDPRSVPGRMAPAGRPDTRPPRGPA